MVTDNLSVLISFSENLNTTSSNVGCFGELSLQ